MESKGLDMAAYPGEGLNTGWLGEGGRLESGGDGFEQHGSCAGCKVMAHKTETGQVLFIQVGEQVVATLVVEPETDEGGARRQDQVTNGADGAVGAGCQSSQHMMFWDGERKRSLTSSIDGGGGRQWDLAKQEPRTCSGGGGRDTAITTMALAGDRALERRRCTWGIHLWCS